MNKVPINKDEVLRYLGYKNQSLDRITNKLIGESMKEMRVLIRERYDYRFFDISKIKDNILLCGSNFKLIGKDIRKHQDKSQSCVLMGVTLGYEVDTRIRYYEKISMDKALILDACATVTIEEICDRICMELDIILEKDNKELTSRYSPGYGDLPLNIQGDFLSVLGVEKSIGLTATSSSILIPRKSVTAIMGVVDKGNSKEKISCLDCNKYSTCIYRKGGEKSGA